MSNIVSTKELEDFAKRLYFITARPTSIQRENFYSAYLIHNKYSLVESVLALPLSQTESEWYGDEKTYIAYLEGVAQEYTEPGFFEVYKQRVEQYSDSWFDACTKVHDAVHEYIETNTNDALISALESYNEYINRPEGALYFALGLWAFEQYALPVMQKKLEHYFGETYEHVWNIISAQTRVVADQQHRIEIAEAKKQYAQNTLSSVEFKARIEEINDTYRYIFKYEPESVGNIPDNFVEDVDPREVDAFVQVIDENKKQYDELLTTIADEQIKEIVEFINFNVYFRTQRMEIYGKGFSLLTSMYDVLEKELQYTRQEIGNLTNAEIMNYFIDGVKPPQRPLRYGVIYRDKEVEFLTKEQTAELEHVLHIQSDVSELQGVVASTGTARGTVRIIIGKSDLVRVQEGDILVAQFTRPEYVPAMKLAGAIITNDGGITSHAAIVSRELRKPCIIDTKCATRVFKEGDIVEVDTHTAVVRKVV